MNAFFTFVHLRAGKETQEERSEGGGDSERDREVEIRIDNDWTTTGRRY